MPASVKTYTFDRSEFTTALTQLNDMLVTFHRHGKSGIVSAVSPRSLDMLWRKLYCQRGAPLGAPARYGDAERLGRRDGDLFSCLAMGRGVAAGEVCACTFCLTRVRRSGPLDRFKDAGLRILRL